MVTKLDKFFRNLSIDSNKLLANSGLKLNYSKYFLLKWEMFKKFIIELKKKYRILLIKY